MRQLVGALIVATWASALLAQQRPAFGGRWVVAGADSQPGQPLVVHQSATAIEVENWSGRGPKPGTRDWAAPFTSAAPGMPRVFWQGQTLVVEFSPLGGDSPETRTETWSLDVTGKLTVVVETARPTRARTVEHYLYRPLAQP